MERKTMAAMVTVLFLTLSLVAIPAVLAAPKTYKGSEVIFIGAPYGPFDHWKGPIVGDMVGITGESTVEFWETSANFVVGQTEHFFETFTITTSCGTISGTDDGIWNFASFNFKAHGPVTSVTGSCDLGLVGYTFDEVGTTSDGLLFLSGDMAFAVGVASWSLTP